MKFTFQAYKEMIDLLKENGYAISDYYGYEQYDKVAILRHDVDMDLNKALEMAKYEHQLGIKTTYFVLLTSDFYNVFSEKNEQILKEIMSLGHTIGLHFDETKYEDCDDITEAIEQEIYILQKCLGKQVGTVSMHRPSQKALDENWIISNGTVINSYSTEFFREFKYVSDSRGHWREDINGLIKSNTYNRLHILSHPIWYNEKERSVKQCLEEFVSSARSQRYKTLDDNIRDLDQIMLSEDE